MLLPCKQASCCIPMHVRCTYELSNTNSNSSILCHNQTLLRNLEYHPGCHVWEYLGCRGVVIHGHCRKCEPCEHAMISFQLNKKSCTLIQQTSNSIIAVVRNSFPLCCLDDFANYGHVFFKLQRLAAAAFP